MNASISLERPAVAALILTLALLARAVPGATAVPPARAEGTPTAFAPPTATATATAVVGPGLCTVAGEHRAGTSRMELRQTLGLSMSLSATCPEGLSAKADIMLTLDYSASMLEEAKYDAALSAVKQFLDNVDFDQHRVGLVPFNNSAYVAQTPTHNRSYLDLALKNIGQPTGGTNIGDALATADRELSSGGRREAVWIIILLTDGRSAPEPMYQAAAAAREHGIVLFTIGLGSDVANDDLRAIATSPDHYHASPDGTSLAQIYLDIAAMIRQVTVTDIVLVDRLSPVVTYLPGSALPREPDIPAGARDLRWRIPFLATNRALLSYTVQPQQAGLIEPSELAWADYTDGDGVRRRFIFPSPKVEVLAPERHLSYLPVLFQNHCLPSTQRSDVVLAMDNSSSMIGAPLESAVAAAIRFIGLLSLPSDRAALVTYSGHADVIAPLTGSRAELEAALLALRTGSGTRIDLGLQRAGEVLSGRADRSRRPVIVLLSDGRQSGPGDVLGIARALRAQGVTIYAIGFGDGADKALLTGVTGRADRDFSAADGEALAQIYDQLAVTVACR